MSLQIDKAIGFLQTNGAFVRELASYEGVEHIYFDFGVEPKSPFWFPVRLAHKLNQRIG